ncbi:MAG: Membrane-bound lytic murein transglycosylase D precursor [bacterium ADurb.Bin478]|nr:MAG: Membrane-bound lytic murein transglycosylase D precursor [bacterium ADurb.Bin478]
MMVKTAGRWLVLASVLVLAAGSRAAEIFPVGPEMQKRVDFWVKIYTQYSKEEMVLHDADHLEVIYDVANVHESFFERLTRRGRKRYLESVTQEYRTILAKLATLKEPIDTAGLSDKELFVYNLWAHVQDADKFARAKDNIHAQAGLRSLYQSGLQRSGRYLTEIKKIFRHYGLPEDLAYLPHVESAYNHRAYSKVGAAGMWQFTGSTGRLYLRVNYSLDERYDPWLSTDAAARLLRHNYEYLGTWPLALTAYNHGAGGMKKAKTLLGTDNLEEIIKRYDGRAFGFASKNFYAEFIAAVQVAKNYQRYFGDIAFDKPDSFKIFQTPSQMTLDALASLLQIDKTAIAQLNPALRPPILRSQRRIPAGYSLRLPANTAVETSEWLAKAAPGSAQEPPQDADSYIVEKGDNLSTIAQNFGVSIAEIMDLNDIRNPRSLRVGQKLTMPAARSGRTAAAQVAAFKKDSSAVQPQAQAHFQPEAIDSSAYLLARARHHAASAAQYGPSPAADSAGYFVVTFDEPQDNVIIVQSEESVGHLAEWLGITPQKLRQLNRMGPHANVQVGRKLTVDFTRVSQRDFHRQRLEFHRSLQQGFFSQFKVQGTRTYTIKNGDSVFFLAEIIDLPLYDSKQPDLKAIVHDVYASPATDKKSALREALKPIGMKIDD